MVQMSRRSRAVLAALAVAVAGCGTPSDASDDTIAPVTPVPTVAGVGTVPVAPSAVREPIVVVRPPVNQDGTEAQLIGEIAEGNRILMIGDSILASTSSRYGNHMCDAVVPLGWQVAVEAEPSRFIDFGNRVLDRMLPDEPDPEPGDDWDAAVVFLGSNYGSDQAKYEAELVRILDRLAPRPTLLLTVTEYRPNYVEVNEVVNRLGAERDNVTVLDWKTISETPGVLSSDRLHPTNAGRQVLAESVAAALGPYPDTFGECLRATFRDDSRVGGNATTVLGQPSTGSGSSRTTTTTSPSSGVTTTVGVPATTTTLPGTGSGGSSGGGSGSGTTTTTVRTTTSSSAPATTAPPSTSAPTTAPPTTAPPTTAPPTTAAPTTAPTTPATTAPPPATP
jgi:hypothetical protein